MGMNDATIYNPKDSSVGGTHAFFLLRGDARAYNLPQNPVMPTTHLKDAWRAAAVGAAAIAIATVAAFLLEGGRLGRTRRASRPAATRSGEDARPERARRPHSERQS